MNIEVGKIYLIDLSGYFYSDSEGNGRGWPISSVVGDEAAYFTVTAIRPGARKPIHLSGKYGALGWVDASVF